MLLFKPGQRWYSSAEPELGLGTILRADNRQVDIVFTGCAELKHYASASAPLIRCEFSAQDHISVDGVSVCIESVNQLDGLLNYHCTQYTYHEGQLDSEQPIMPPALRLLLNQSDESHLYDLRRQCFQHASSAHLQQLEQDCFESLFIELLSYYGAVFSPLSEHNFLLDASQLNVDAFDALKVTDLACTFSADVAKQDATLLYFDHTHALFQALFDEFINSHSGSASFMTDDTLHPRSVVLESVFSDAENIAYCFAVDAKLNLLPSYAPNEQAVFRARNREIDLKPFKRSLELIYPSLLHASQEAALAVNATKLQALRLIAGSEFAAFGKSKR
jgi:hypothetical protein